MGSSDNGSIMPDVYATITEADPATLERLVGAMEIRAAQPRQRRTIARYSLSLSIAPITSWIRPPATPKNFSW